MIEIHSPEVEALIRQRMSNGKFNNPEDVIVEALKLHPVAPPPAVTRPRPAGRKSLAQLFADSPFKGLDIDFERDPDDGRDAVLPSINP